MLRERGRFICALKKKLPRIFLNEKKISTGYLWEYVYKRLHSNCLCEEAGIDDSLPFYCKPFCDVWPFFHMRAFLFQKENTVKK